MFYHLLAPLGKTFIIFNLFNYISFRAAGATVTALLLSFLVGPVVIARLRARKVGQVIRAEGPVSHQSKRGTPTMGGLIIILATVVPTLLWAPLTNRFVVVAMLSTLWMGCIGFLDDYLKIVQGKSRGLVARWKLVGQVSFGLLLGLFLTFYPVVPTDTIPATATTLPFFKYLVVNFAPWLYVAFVTLVITGTSNAVNLTDGLDGLAAGLAGIAAAAFATFAYLFGRVDVTGYLNLFYLPGAGELDRLLRGAHGSDDRVSVVQRASGSGVHGRHREPRDRRCAGNRGHPSQGGVPSSRHRRHLRRRGGVGAAADRDVQVAQAYPGTRVRRRPPRLPHGPASPSLRKTRLGRDHRRDPVLYPWPLLRAHRALHAEGSLTVTTPIALFEEWRRTGREVAVVGLGKSGVAATRLLRSHGLPVYASDTGTGARFEEWSAGLRSMGADVDLGRHDLARIAGGAAVVVSPGVPPDVPPLQTAREASVPVYAEVDIGFVALDGTRCIGITGTNGKTTTTSLITHLLVSGGIAAESAGNIGRPLSDVALAESPPKWLALELSSFQLHDAPHLRPAIGVLTNLAPNHLDRYATLEEYYGDKAQLFRNADSDSVWVSNADDAAVAAMAGPAAGSHLRFSIAGRADGWFDRANGRLMLGDDMLLSRPELPLLGDHNVANALAASLVARRVGCPLDRIAAGLRTFRAIPHRVEPVREVDGVLWINDSKSTNITSTEVAIASLDRPFVLLLGGRHKGEPYTRLAGPLHGRCRAVVAYGEAGPIVAADLAGEVPVVSAGDFDEVIATARRLAQPGDAVLLSPACSSYDMFRDYEQRGDRFRAAVEAMR